MMAGANMRVEEQVRVIKGLMTHLDNGTNVDAGVIRRVEVTDYTSPERAAQEWEILFRCHPQVIGMSGDLPRPGSFLTTNDFGTPILATRDGAGRFRAFANVCRHRGTIVETASRGEKSRFSCPFHAWTYDNAGALIGLPKGDHFGAVDKACLGLVELPSEERHGFLFVHPKADGKLNAATLLAGLDQEFETWDFKNLIHIGDDTYETPMNWKLAIDTFGETYHFEKLHRDTLANVFYGNVQLYDTYGRNHRMALCVRTIDQMRDMPEEDWRVTMGAFPVYYLFPNIQVNVGANGVTLVRVYPEGDAPGRSLSRVSFYLWPGVAEAEAERNETRAKGFAGIIRDEDYVAAASSYVGAESGQISHFIFGRNEPALHHYHSTYREALGLPPLEIVRA
jgi:phenylpropionate dioxygenase-like ring-hydroxylating dioxygenase large terminal subunit